MVLTRCLSGRGRDLEISAEIQAGMEGETENTLKIDVPSDESGVSTGEKNNPGMASRDVRNSFFHH